MDNFKIVGYEIEMNLIPDLILVVKDESNTLEKGYTTTEGDIDLINDIINYNVENVNKDEDLKDFWGDFLGVEEEELIKEIKTCTSDYNIKII